MTTIDKRYLTVKQVAQKLNIGEEHTRRLIRAGKLKSCPRNPGQKQMFIRAQDVNNYLEGRA